jgi:hypothetical protein
MTSLLSHLSLSQSKAGAIQAHKVCPLHSPERFTDAMEASFENAMDVLHALVWPQPKRSFCG